MTIEDKEYSIFKKNAVFEHVQYEADDFQEQTSLYTETDLVNAISAKFDE